MTRKLWFTKLATAPVTSRGKLGATRGLFCPRLSHDLPNCRREPNGGSSMNGTDTMTANLTRTKTEGNRYHVDALGLDIPILERSKAEYTNLR
jgi:hypothetical protein